MFETRQSDLCARMKEAGIDLALITDEDNVYYLSGYFDYLHMEFGRPTILVLHQSGESLLITPSIDLEAAKVNASVDRIADWNDGVGDEWRAELPGILGQATRIGLEPDAMPPLVKRAVDDLAGGTPIVSLSPQLGALRMIKSEEELQIARHAGQVAMSMMQAARETIGVGVPEFEVALATHAAGTRKAAELLDQHYAPGDMSPNMHFLQIMASGDALPKTHHRATTRVMQAGDPVFMCFCGMTNFHRFKLGFDRTFWIGEPADPSQIPIYETAVESQAAALRVLGPGVEAQEVHAAYADVIEAAGYEFPFRCGRATGFSYLEHPQLVTGDTTRLQPGMVFAVDGSVATDTFRAQVGDSFIITDQGYEPLTHHPKSPEDVILAP